MIRHTRLKSVSAKRAAADPRATFSTFSAKPTRVKPVNVTRQKKRRRSYAHKLAAYHRSETAKIVARRANGQCEVVLVWDASAHSVAVASAKQPGMRCHAKTTLHHHHKTYARFGGKELPSDMVAACDRCHALLESQHPTRTANRKRQSLAGSPAPTDGER